MKTKANELPLISVIVPIYKIESYLVKCIESLLQQTYHNLEIILVDDGSPDKCGEICDLYAQKDARVKVIHQENQGLVAARKMGLKKATGVYVGYVDGDDWVEEEYYEQMVFNAIETKADVVISNHSRDFFDISIPISSNCFQGTYHQEDMQDIYLKMISFGEFYTPGVSTYVWNKLFKSLLLNGLTFDNSIYYGEDAAFVWQTLQRVSKVALVNKSFYHYGENEDSLSRQAFNSYKLSSYKVWDLIARETDEQWPQYSGIAHAQLAYQLTQVLLASIADQYHIEKTLRKSIQKLIRRDWHLMKDSGHTSSRMTIFSWGVSHHFKLMWFIFPVFRPYFEKKYRYM